jgi:hypothetical protein
LDGNDQYIHDHVRQVLEDKFTKDCQSDMQLLLHFVHQFTLRHADQTEVVLRNHRLSNVTMASKLLLPTIAEPILEEMKKQYIHNHFDFALQLHMDRGIKALSWEVGMQFFQSLLLANSDGWVSIVDARGQKRHNWVFVSISSHQNYCIHIRMEGAEKPLVFYMKKHPQRVGKSLDGHTFATSWNYETCYLKILTRPHRMNAKKFFGDNRRNASYPVVYWNDAILLIGKVRDALVELELPGHMDVQNLQNSKKRKRKQERPVKAKLPPILIHLCLQYLFCLDVISHDKKMSFVEQHEMDT